MNVEVIGSWAGLVWSALNESGKLTVKALKKDFADNFTKYKKDASLMDTVAAKAMSNIKWNGFKWGMGIGAALGAAISLIATRD